MDPKDSAKAMKCKDFGDNPDCLETVDPTYTMDWSDIGEPPMYFCSHCGKIAESMNDAIENAFRTRLGFAKELEAAIKNEERKIN